MHTITPLYIKQEHSNCFADSMHANIAADRMVQVGYVSATFSTSVAIVQYGYRNAIFSVGVAMLQSVWVWPCYIQCG